MGIGFAAVMGGMLARSDAELLQLSQRLEGLGIGTTFASILTEGIYMLVWSGVGLVIWVLLTWYNVRSHASE